ncbi:unnamed protein product [Pseudo-nitzschia multistriata]|uniref:Glutaminase n=1 Tax=Pseudo-nitzschia multistriata TaxID=183589 RepID=A0A448ZTH0_9STRA|nr:unnamed protein product [Pseudo-nitzschia multistriata]
MSNEKKPLVGVLSIQGAFEEHQACLEASGCRTKQIRTVADMTEGGEALDGMVLPGGESTAMGLIGTATKESGGKSVWDALRDFIEVDKKPTWGTCAGMILLAERCVGASAVIQDGQALIGGMDILVCRNYFGSQVSSFEMATPPPPTSGGEDGGMASPYPGVFIRAPAILSAGQEVTVLGKVVATPCRQAAVVLEELERKIEKGETVVQMGVVDALERDGSQLRHREVVKASPCETGEEKKELEQDASIELPGAADGSNAREVICAVRKSNLLCTAFHPELTNDHRWHQYFAQMVKESVASA